MEIMKYGKNYQELLNIVIKTNENIGKILFA